LEFFTKGSFFVYAISVSGTKFAYYLSIVDSSDSSIFSDTSPKYYNSTTYGSDITRDPRFKFSFHAYGGGLAELSEYLISLYFF